MPGALTLRVDFAAVFAGAAAGAVKHTFGTAGNGADTAILVKHARAAGGAFFRPDASFFEDADKGRIKARVNGFAGITLGNSAG